MTTHILYIKGSSALFNLNANCNQELNIFPPLPFIFNMKFSQNENDDKLEIHIKEINRRQYSTSSFDIILLENKSKITCSKTKIQGSEFIFTFEKEKSKFNEVYILLLYLPELIQDMISSSQDSHDRYIKTIRGRADVKISCNSNIEFEVMKELPIKHIFLVRAEKEDTFVEIHQPQSLTKNTFNLNELVSLSNDDFPIIVYYGVFEVLIPMDLFDFKGTRKDFGLPILLAKEASKYHKIPSMPLYNLRYGYDEGKKIIRFEIFKKDENASNNEENASKNEENASKNEENASKSEENASKNEENASNNEENASKSEENASKNEENASKNEEENASKNEEEIIYEHIGIEISSKYGRALQTGYGYLSKNHPIIVQFFQSDLCQIFGNENIQTIKDQKIGLSICNDLVYDHQGLPKYYYCLESDFGIHLILRNLFDLFVKHPSFVKGKCKYLINRFVYNPSDVPIAAFYPLIRKTGFELEKDFICNKLNEFHESLLSCLLKVDSYKVEESVKQNLNQPINGYIFYYFIKKYRGHVTIHKKLIKMDKIPNTAHSIYIRPEPDNERNFNRDYFFNVDSSKKSPAPFMVPEDEKEEEDKKEPEEEEKEEYSSSSTEEKTENEYEYEEEDKDD